MFFTHFKQLEKELLTVAQRPASSGHSLHKGTPRENFVKTYLKSHLSSLLAIGSGEIIDASSKPGAKRPQVDLVIYKRQYPKLDFGGNIDAFFVESVLASIEVKSTLTKTELQKGMRAAQKLKMLARDQTSTWTIGPGYKAPGLLSFLVAYDGPKNMTKVHRWLCEINKDMGLVYPSLGATLEDRQKVVPPALDGVFVFGRGLVLHDSLPISPIHESIRAQNPQLRWVTLDMALGSLLFLFSILSVAGNGVVFHGLNPLVYLQGVDLDAELHLNE